MIRAVRILLPSTDVSSCGKARRQVNKPGWLLHGSVVSTHTHTHAPTHLHTHSSKQAKRQTLTASDLHYINLRKTSTCWSPFYSPSPVRYMVCVGESVSASVCLSSPPVSSQFSLMTNICEQHLPFLQNLATMSASVSSEEYVSVCCYFVPSYTILQLSSCGSGSSCLSLCPDSHRAPHSPLSLTLSLSLFLRVCVPSYKTKWVCLKM